MIYSMLGLFNLPAGIELSLYEIKCWKYPEGMIWSWWDAPASANQSQLPWILLNEWMYTKNSITICCFNNLWIIIMYFVFIVQIGSSSSVSDLRSRGLCLVPMSCTMRLASSNMNIGADYWASNHHDAKYNVQAGAARERGGGVDWWAHNSLDHLSYPEATRVFKYIYI